MPFKCCVSNCKGNYKSEPHVTVFRFPQDLDLNKNGYTLSKEKILCHPKLDKVT